MRSKILWTICSLFLVSCSERPDAELCVVEAGKMRLACYNLATDYDDNGKLKPGAQRKYHPIADLKALDKGTFASVNDFPKIKASFQKLREDFRACEEGQ